MTTTIKVFLNEGEDNFFGFVNDFANAPALRLAAEFDLVLPSVRLIDGKPLDVLERVFEQLNIGGDLVPAEPWTDAYRAAGNRSLSVGDVVVVGEAAFAVGSYGWDAVPTGDLVAAINKEA